MNLSAYTVAFLRKTFGQETVQDDVGDGLLELADNSIDGPGKFSQIFFVIFFRLPVNT